MEKEEVVRDNIENEDARKALDELKRRIDLTRRARFSCSTRLRSYFNRIQNLIVYYNVLIVLQSIVTLYYFYDDNASWVTYVTLAFSVALSFFATHIGGKNYKEKAIMMESNGHELSKIYGKISMSSLNHPLETSKVSNLYKEYERTLVIVENHDPVDYLEAKKVKGIIEKDEEKVLDRYNSRLQAKFVLAYIIPTLIVLSFLFYPIVFN